MSESAGELHLDVGADTTGFAQALRRKVQAEAKNVRAQVRVGVEVNDRGLKSAVRASVQKAQEGARVRLNVELNDRGIVGQARAAARKAEAAAKVRLPVELQTRGLVAQATAAAAEVSAAAKAKVELDVDRTGTAREVQSAVSEAARAAKGNATVDVDADTKPASEKIARERARQEHNPITIPVRLERGTLDKLTQVSGAITKVVGLTGLIGSAVGPIISLVGGLGQVVSGLFAITSAAGPAVGALGLIPSGLAAIAQAAGTVIAAFRGVGDAVKAGTAAQASATADAQAAAQKQAAAAQQVAAAQRGVQQARRQVADTEQQVAESIAAAQQRVADARRSEVRTEQDVARSIAEAQQRVTDARRAAGQTAQDVAESIAAAQQRVADAQANVARVAQDNADAIAGAEEQVTQAQDRSRSAQEALNRAREDATQRLKDMRYELQDAALSEESAQLALERAQKRRGEVLADPRKSSLDKREADLAFRQAQFRLGEVRRSNQQLAKEAADARRKGVAGAAEVVDAQANVTKALSDQNDAEKNLERTRQDARRRTKDALANVAEAEAGVTKARADGAQQMRDAAREITAAEQDLTRTRTDGAQQVADANRAVVDAEKDLAKTRRDGARQMEDSQRSLADAQRTLADAQKALTQATNTQSSAQEKYNAAMANLTPAGRSFVRFLIGEFIPAWKQVGDAAQSALLPDVETSMRRLIRLTGPMTKVVQATAAVLGDLMVQAANLVTSPVWQRDIVTIGKDNATALGLFGQAAINLLNPLRDMLVVLGHGENSLVQRFGRWTVALTENIAASTEAARANGNLARFFDRTGDVLAQWGRIIGNIAKGIYNIGKQATPAGQALTDSFEGATETFVEWTKTNGRDIRKFFDDLKPVVRSFGRILVDVAQLLGDVMSDPSNQKVMESLEKTLIPALRRLIAAFQQSGTGEKFIGILSDLADTITSLVESGALGTFTDILATLVGWLKAAADNPVGKWVFKGLFGLAAIVGPLGLVAGHLTKMATSIAKIARKTGVVKVLKALRSAWLASKLPNRGGAENPYGTPKTPKTPPGTVVTKDGPNTRVPRGTTGGGGGGSYGEPPLIFGEGGSRRGAPNTRIPKVPKTRFGRFLQIAGRGVKGSKFGRIVGGGARLLGKGGVVGIGASILGGVAGDAVSDGHGGARDAGGGLLSGAASGGATGALIGSIVPGVGTAIGAAAGVIVGGLVGAFTTGGKKGVKALVTSIGQSFVDSDAPINNWIRKNVNQPIKDAFGTAWSAVKDRFVSQFKKQITGPIANAWDGVKDRFVSQFNKQIVNPIKNAWSTAVHWNQMGVDAIGGFFKGLWRGISNSPMGKWVGQHIVQPVKDFLGIKSPSTLFATIGRNIIDGLIAGVKSLGGKAKDAIVGLFTSAGTRIKAWFTALPGKIKGWGKSIGTGLANAWSALGKGASGVGSWLAGMGTSIRDWFTSLPGKIKGWAAALGKKWGEEWGRRKTQIVTTLSAARGAIADWFKGLPGKVKGWFAGLAKQWQGRWEDRKTEIVTTLSKARDAIRVWLTSLPGKIKGWFKGIAKQWAANWTDAKDRVAKFVTDSTTNIRKFLTSLPGKIAGWFKGIAKQWKDRWDDARKTVVTKITDARNWFGKELRALPGRIGGWFKGIATKWRNLWDDTRKTVVTKITDARNWFGKTLRALPGNISGWFRQVAQTWTRKWDGIKQTTFDVMRRAKDRVQSVLGNIKTAFKNGVDGVRSRWNQLEGVAKKPIKFIVGTVFNKGLRVGINRIASAVGAGKQIHMDAVRLPFREGGHIMRRGGSVPGTSPSDVADNVPIMATAGEFMIRRPAVRLLNRAAPGMLDHINEHGTLAGYRPGYFGGGLISSAWDGIKGGASALKDLAGSALGKGKKLLSKVLGVIGGAVKGGIAGMLRKFVPSLAGLNDAPLGRAAKASVPALIKAAAAKLLPLARSAAATEGTGAAVPPGSTKGVYGWSKQWAWLHKAFPSAILTSSFRPGAITASGNQSYHSMGRAIDVSPSMAIFNTIRKAFGASIKELIYSPAGARQVKDGHSYVYGEPVKSMHYNHVHWAMARGGLVPPRLFDNGGVFRDGQVGVNLSGRDEVVFNDRQWAILSRLVAQGAQTRSGRLGRDEAIRNYFDTGAVQFFLNQQRDTTPEQTLNAGLRRAAEFGLFG